MMPERAVEPDLVALTRRLFDAASGGDFDAMLRFFGADSVWDVEAWGLGTHVGPAAIRRFLEGWIGSFDEYHVAVEEVVQYANGVVFAVATQHGRSAHTPGEVRLRYAPVFVWREGVAVRVTHHRDVDEARAAAERHAASPGEAMSANGDLLRSIFAAWERGDFASGIEPLAADIRYSAAQPEGQATASGRDEMTRFLRDFLASWDRYWVELHALLEPAPGRFLAVATQHGRGRDSGAETSMPAFIAIAFRDGEIAQLEFFYERAEALAALDGEL